MMKKIYFLLLLSFFGNTILTSEVNVYTSRHYDSDDALYQEFTKETGIAVNIISGKGSALLQRLKSEGLPVLQAELKSLDPEHYSKMDTSNPQRVVRALEVTLATGKPFSEYHSKKSQHTENNSTRPFDIIQIGLEAPRQISNKRIEERTQLMLDAGWLEETRALLPLRHYNSLNTVGYKELFAHLDGEMTLEEAKERIIISTRQFAKRQMTWFKKDPTITWFDFFEAKDGAHKILAHIHKFTDHA